MAPAIRLMAVGLTATAVFLAGSGPLSGARPAAAVIGVYVGAHDHDGVRQFEGWLGRDVQYALDFVPADSWGTIGNPFLLRLWKADLEGKHYRLVLGVPMVPGTGGSLAEGAAGAYNRHFRRLARNLVRMGFEDSILRLGWEFSGGWYPWSVRSDADARAFAEYWRQIVNTMRKVSTSFEFDWNPAHGWRPFRIGLAYPGSAYVDYIGMDVYDQGWQPEGTSPAGRWADQMNGEGGLVWHRSFARWKGKPMTFPEWGLALREDGRGGGDNPLFVERMHEWISRNNVAYHLYFDFDAPDGRHALRSGQFPAAAAAFKSRFGRVSTSSGSD